MFNLIPKLKLYVKHNTDLQSIPHAKVYWVKIPDNAKNKTVFCNKFKDSETGLHVDITNDGGFTLLWGSNNPGTILWIYLHKVVCTGFKDTKVEKKFSLKDSSEKEFTVYLTPDS